MLLPRELKIDSRSLGSIKRSLREVKLVYANVHIIPSDQSIFEVRNTQ